MWREMGLRMLVLIVLLGAAVSAVFANHSAALILTHFVIAMPVPLGFPPAVTLAFVMAAGLIADTETCRRGIQPGQHRVGQLIRDLLRPLHIGDGTGEHRRRAVETCRAAAGLWARRCASLLRAQLKVRDL